MPSVRPTVSTWISWPSPTGSNAVVSGANGSDRWMALPASTSGAIISARLERAAGKIAVDEPADIAGRLRLRHLENLLVHRRQRAGRIGIGGAAGQREGLAAAAAEIDFLEFATAARFRHPAGTAIAIEGFAVLPDPGDRMIGSDRIE